MHHFIFVGCSTIVLVGDSTNKHQELYVFHLVRPSLVNDRILNGAHGLSVDGATLHIGYIKAGFANELPTFSQSHEFLLAVSI